MSKFLRHEACPECGSKDNVGVWDDGGKYCFGCHWWTAPNHTSKISAIQAFDLQHRKNSDGDEIIELPTDFSNYVPPQPYNWLRQYLTHLEVTQKGFGWSASEQRLIYPYYESEVLKFWTGRYFGSDPTAPKYWSEGARGKVIMLHTNNVMNDRVVFVEDVISAIKVGRVATACPILGSRIPTEYLVALSKTFSKAVIWLDGDKRKEALKQAIHLNSFFRDGVKVVFTDKDPKTYANNEILTKIGREYAG